MKTQNTARALWLCAAMVSAIALPASASVITNGGFESGFTGWTTVDQTGGDGTFYLQTGASSPANSFPVPAPPEGIAAAMTDAFGPGSHLLYQDFVVPNVVTATSIRFSLFLNNGNDAPDYFMPAHLDFATPDLNQQARVDIMTTTADPFSVASSDVLQNLFQTNPGDTLVSGYNNFVVDITALLQAHQGETLRLRFAEVDNVAPFNLGVDNVSTGTPVPEPSTLLLSAGTLLTLGALRRRPT